MTDELSTNEDGQDGAHTDSTPPYRISTSSPQDIIDITVEFSEEEFRRGINVNDPVETVLRIASLHFQSIGFTSLKTEILRNELTDQLANLLTRQSVDRANFKDDVEDALRAYNESEGKKASIRWRSRIGLAADGLSLISAVQTLGGFAFGFVEGRITSHRPIIASRHGRMKPLVFPWPVTGLMWDYHTFDDKGWWNLELAIRMPLRKCWVTLLRGPAYSIPVKKSVSTLDGMFYRWNYSFTISELKQMTLPFKCKFVIDITPVWAPNMDIREELFVEVPFGMRYDPSMKRRR